MKANHKLATPKAVTDFLMEFKKNSGDMGRMIKFTDDRAKNFWTLIELNLTILQALEKILSLTYKNYILGPYKREDGSGNLWAFGLEVEGRPIYIKLCDDFSTGYALCVSFHKPEKLMKFIY